MTIKKAILIIFFVFSGTKNYSQISIGSRHKGSAKKFNTEIITKFKSSKTLFILPEIFKKEDYEKILKDVWTVTPYEIVNKSEFKYDDYFEDSYSFLEVTTPPPPPTSSSMIGGKSASLYSRSEYIIDLFLFQKKELKKKLLKISSKKSKNKNYKIREEFFVNRDHLAKVHLYPDNITYRNSVKSIDRYKEAKFLKTISLSSYKDEDVEDFKNILNTEKLFYNFELGYLKNYLQTINSFIEKEKTYWLYTTDFKPELKKLSKSVLYVPDYILKEAVPFVHKNNTDASRPEDKKIAELFEKYEFTFSEIDSKELDKKILSGEELYYLRFVPLLSGERFLQVVNSKTGEEIYQLYLIGGGSFGVNLKKKNIKELNAAIKKAVKKY